MSLAEFAPYLVPHGNKFLPISTGPIFFIFLIQAVPFTHIAFNVLDNPGERILATNSSLIFTTLWANSVGNKLMISSFSENTGFDISCRLYPFGADLLEMSKPVF